MSLFKRIIKLKVLLFTTHSSSQGKLGLPTIESYSKTYIMSHQLLKFLGELFNFWQSNECRTVSLHSLPLTYKDRSVIAWALPASDASVDWTDNIFSSCRQCQQLSVWYRLFAIFIITINSFLKSISYLMMLIIKTIPFLMLLQYYRIDESLEGIPKIEHLLSLSFNL